MRRYERKERKMPILWNKDKSKRKAKHAAVGAAKGPVAGAALAGLVVLLRTVAPNVIKWPAEHDQAVITGLLGIGLVLAPVWAWISRYRQDKDKHGGTSVTGNFNASIAILCSLGLLMGGAGCQSDGQPDWVQIGAAIDAGEQVLRILERYGVISSWSAEAEPEDRDIGADILRDVVARLGAGETAQEIADSYLSGDGVSQLADALTNLKRKADI